MSLKKQFIRDISELSSETSRKQFEESEINIDHIKGLVASGDLIQLKNICRTEATCYHPNHEIRSDLWKVLCDLHRKPGARINVDPNQFAPLFNEIEEQQNDSGFIDRSSIKSNKTEQQQQSSPRKLPGFVDLNCCRYFHLNPVGQKLVERILWSIAHDHPEITFSPLLYPIASLFLHYMDPVDVLTSLLILIEGNKIKSHPMIPTSKGQMSRDAYVLTKLTNKFGLSIISMILPSKRGRLFQVQRQKLSSSKEIDDCFHDWLKWIFVGLPFKHLIRIMDCFLVEGFKFLFRIGLSLLLLYSRSSSEDQLSLDSMITFCESISSSPQQLIDFATSLARFSGDKLMKQYEKADLQLKQFPSLSSGFTPQSSPCLARRRDMIRKDIDQVHISSRVAPRDLKSSIIDWFLLDSLWEWLPERIAIKEPVIAFSTDVDGSSLRTFFDKTSPYESSILLIKTTNDEIFGAYCSSSWANRLSKDTPGTFFGTGETFLFTLKPKSAKYEWVGEGSGRTRGNRSSQLFMSSNSKCLIIGSGGGSGLWLDEELTKGKSEVCMTFNNQPLSQETDFECAVIEVIGFE